MPAEAQSKVPRIQRVSFANSPARGDTFELGEKIEVTVRFDRTVELFNDGMLKLALAVGDGTRYAQSYSITNQQELNFYYRIGADDHDADGISIPAGELLLEHGTFTDLADRSTDAELTHGPIPAGASRKVDGSRITAPRISHIYYLRGRPGVGGREYRHGHRIQVRVEFDRAVHVTGVPQIPLMIGSETRQATFIPDHWDFVNPESSLYFCYSVRPEDRDTDGISIPADSLSLNGGAITLAGDAATEAVLTHVAVEDRYTKVIGTRTGMEVVRHTISEAWKQLIEGVLDVVAPYRVTRSYPAEIPCPGES
ncbi:MAG: hypothetical protein OXJ90_19075 [Spirochaetaceae bacterium]|nr:hypothetical protein [Spirochaetaceae bacterium]